MGDAGAGAGESSTSHARGSSCFGNPEFDSAVSSSVLQPPDFLQENNRLYTQVAAPRWAWQMFFCFELNF
jgi:hypothetical protein